MSLVKTMWLALREGINVIKHGRKGKPSHKTLFCDYYMTKLYWRNPGSKLDKDDLDASMDHDLHAVNSAYTNTTGTSDPDSLQDSGSLFKSKNSSLDVKRRSSFFGSTNRRSSLTKADSERVLFLKDIVNITHDCTSEVLQRASAKNYLGTNGYNILSIIAIGRSLDMEIEQVSVLESHL